MSCGSITVRNGGGYVARFYVKYTGPDGERHQEDSGDFTLGVNKSIELPPGSTLISLKVEEFWGFVWSTIFVKEFDTCVTKCYEIYGTTLDPHYHEKQC